MGPIIRTYDPSENMNLLEEFLALCRKYGWDGTEPACDWLDRTLSEVKKEEDE